MNNNTSKLDTLHNIYRLNNMNTILHSNTSNNFMTYREKIKSNYKRNNFVSSLNPFKYLTKVLAGLLICITFASKAQNITFVSSANRTFGDAPFIVLATSSSTLPIFYSASSTLVNININTVTMRGAGVLNITAYRSGGSSALQILTINKKAQSIIFGALPQKTFGDAPFIITGRSSTSLPVSYFTSNTNISISNNTVSIKKAGIVSIIAYQTGNENYLKADSVVQILTINKKAQSIIFGALPQKTFGDAPFIITGRSSTSLPVSYSVSNPIVQISRGRVINGVNIDTIKIIGVGSTGTLSIGTVTITAYSENDTLFGFTKQILTIHKKTQSIFFETLLTRIIGDTTRFILSAVSSASLPVLFSSASHLISINNDDTMKINVGTVSRVITVSTLKSNGVGMASITAYHTNNNYTNPPITQVLNIQPSLVYRDRDGDGLIEIYSINQLDSIRNNLTGICNVGTCNGYELTISLDFNNISSYRDTTKIFKTFTERSGSGWSPIGIAITASDTIQGIPYSAIFEGNGFTIDNLYINRKNADYVGFFAWTGESSNIRNIGIRNAVIKGRKNVGGLVGYNFRGTITQTYAKDSVFGGLYGGSYYGGSIGGLVGRNTLGKISQSYTTGYICDTFNLSTNTGGLVGYHEGGAISESYSTASVSGHSIVGGLVGFSRYGFISQSYATGSVSASDSIVGGLLGMNYVGYALQSYATGSVSGTSSVGGLVGWSAGTVLYCYWNKDSAQLVNRIPRDNNRKIGLGKILKNVLLGPRIITPIDQYRLIYEKGLTLAAMKSPTGLDSDSIRELGPGFIYTPGHFPGIHRGARITIGAVEYTQTIPGITNNIEASGTIEYITEGTDSTRATIILDGVHFTSNLPYVNSETGDSIWNIQNGTGSGIIGSKNTVIDFPLIGSKTHGDEPFTLRASSFDNLPVSFFVSNTLLEIRENIATINGAGTVSITAYTRNDTVFGFSTQIITINRRNQSVSFEALSTKTFGNGSFVLEAKSSSGLPVMFSASSTLVSINTNTASIKGAGTVNITAYSGNSVLFGFVTRMLTIYKATQSVSFGALSTKTFGDGPFVLQASSSSGLPIIFLVSNNLVSINNNTVTINGAGMVNITAYQIGNENYLQGFALQTLAIQTTIINPLTFIGKENPAINIYPNPANGFITIQTDKNQKASSVKIYNLAGREIMNYSRNVIHSISTETLPKGQYIIIIYGETGVVLKAEKITIK